MTLVTRFDALEKKWGDQTWYASAAYDVTNRLSTGATSIRTQENIEWELAYVDFTTGIGRFMVGYQDFVIWGTKFFDSSTARPGIKYMLPMGDVTLVAAWEKVGEGSSTLIGTSATNWLYQVYGGFKFTPKLELYASLSMAKADEKPAANWVDKDMGTELDVTLTYKIFDNLSYMIGAGYWWVGDYFKGTSTTNKIDDTYLLMHKLTLTF